MILLTTPANDYYITKIAKYLNQPYNRTMLVHLKNKIMKDVSKEHENYRRKIISSLGLQTDILQSEVYFLGDEPKGKNTLIKLLIAPYTLNIEHKERKTKGIKNKRAKDDKNSMNSKNPRIDQVMASRNSPVVNSIDFHFNKLTSEGDILDSKNHVLLPCHNDKEDLPTQAVVSATTTATTINSKNNANAKQEHSEQL